MLFYYLGGKAKNLRQPTRRKGCLLWVTSLISIMIFWNSNVSAEICAKHYLDLNQTEKLKTVYSVLSLKGSRGFVNGTEGSYLTIENQGDAIWIELFSSGLFDLIRIYVRDSVEICDNEGELFLIGMRRRERLRIEDGKIILGRGRPRETFSPGRAPASLQELHGLE